MADNDASALTPTAASPVDVVASRKWERALFTTYALSLTFFESVVLRALREAGCGDIWVIVDRDGYRHSLMERRSYRVGQEYHLIPVFLRDGVFHPKCTYLASSEGDVLLVGSGNLTFGGYGRNLEVLETLVPESAPACFEGFAAFLDALGGRGDASIPDRSWLASFAHRSRASARGAATNRASSYPQLIHNVGRPMDVQLAEAIEPLGECREVVVLSPFHSPDGRAVAQLADRLKAKKIAVVLPPASDDPTAFPFLKTKDWGRGVRAVSPNIEAEARPLHAKWIDIACATSALTFTGSVNATNAALCSTANIEVGILRSTDLASIRKRWRTTATPTSVRNREFIRGATSCVVFAELKGDGSLLGTVLGDSPEGEWLGHLTRTSGAAFPFRASVSEEGRFCVAQVSTELLSAPAVQIELRKQDLVARGWVHQDEWLRMPRLQRLGVSSLVRLINREETEEDDVALLDYLAISAGRHLGTFARRIKPREPEPGLDLEEGFSDSYFTLEDVAPSTEAPQEYTLAPPRLDERSVPLERVFVRLRERLLSGRRMDQRDRQFHNPGSATGDAAEGGEDAASDEGRASAARFSSSLAYFEESVRQLIEGAESEAARRALLVVWVEVQLHVLLRRLDDRSSALGFLREWLQFACGRTRCLRDAGPVEQHVFTAAAIIGRMTTQDEVNEGALTRLHEDLEGFSGGAVSREAAMAALLQSKEGTLVSMILDDAEPQLAVDLERLLSATTLRQQLAEVIEGYNCGKSIERTLTAFKAPAGAELLKALERPRVNGAKPPFRMLPLDGMACPHCYAKFGLQEMLELRRFRIVRCIHCKKLTVRITP